MRSELPGIPAKFGGYSSPFFSRPAFPSGTSIARAKDRTDEALHPEKRHASDRRSDQVAKLATRSEAVKISRPRRYDAAQERGEVVGPRDGRHVAVPDGNSKATTADIGLSRKDVHEAGVIRRRTWVQRSRSSIGCYSPVWGFLAIRSPVWGFLAPSPCAFPEPVGPLSLEPGASAPFCGPPNQSPDPPVSEPFGAFFSTPFCGPPNQSPLTSPVPSLGLTAVCPFC